MISWFQRNFQHHFRAIFGVLLAVTIISFIFTIGATPGIGRSDGRTRSQPFFNYNLALQDDHYRIFGGAQLSIFLHYGRAISDGPQLEGYALQRAASIALADRLHVPPPSDDVLADYIKTMGAFADANGEFDSDRYNTFRADQLWSKLDPRFTVQDVTKVFVDDWRVGQVDKLLAGPGYALPGDIKTLLARADTQWTIAVATIDYTKYALDLSPSQAQLTQFFAEKSSNYEMPARVNVDYLEFPSVDYVPQVVVSADEVRAYYDAHPGQFSKPADLKTHPAPAKPDPDADLAAVRPQVEAALKLERAQQLAEQAASDIALALYNEKINGITPQLDVFLAAHHLTLKSLAPFAADAPPAELGSAPEISDEAFKLGQDHFFSDPLATPKGCVVLLWKESLPAYTPLLSQVQAKVAADYKEDQRRNLFINKLGKTVHDQLVSNLKQGDTFDKAVAITGVMAAISAVPATGVQLEKKTFPPFTLRQPPKDMDENILNNLDHLKNGDVSDMIFFQDKGWFIYVAAKKLPDLSPSNPRFAAARARLALTTAKLTLSSSIEEIVDRELKKSAPANTP